MENEKELLEAAIEKFNTVAGVDIAVTEARADPKSARWDAVLWLQHGGKKHKFLVEIKKGVTTSTAHLIARRLRARAREQKTIPLLIYADLIAVGDPRTIEAAEMIYDECLTRYLGKT